MPLIRGQNVNLGTLIGCVLINCYNKDSRPHCLDDCATNYVAIASSGHFLRLQLISSVFTELLNLTSKIEDNSVYDSN